ncbi:MAG TPA: hypothetical protein VJN18_11130 [Polyangiaceae bacterium]|nr:hypothetical protein [Polyangiaceae bacterium]
MSTSWDTTPAREQTLELAITRLATHLLRVQELIRAPKEQHDPGQPFDWPDYIFAGYQLARASDVLFDHFPHGSQARERGELLHQHVLNWACAHQRWQAQRARRSRSAQAHRDLQAARRYLDKLGGP